MKHFRILTFIISMGFFISSYGQTDTTHNSKRSVNDTTDKAYGVEVSEKQKILDQMIAPYVEQARKTLPNVKKRFLAGLKEGEKFYLVIRIYDKDGKFEQVFVRITDWKDTVITGNIRNELYVVKEYQNGQLITFKEKDVMDWFIREPGGGEEGNFVGKYLDSVQN